MLKPIGATPGPEFAEYIDRLPIKRGQRYWAADLYAAYLEEGGPDITQQSFGRSLRALGWERHKSNGRQSWYLPE